MFARIMPVDDLDHAFGADARNGQGVEDIARDPRSLDFVFTLQFGVFRIRTDGMRELFLGEHLPPHVVQQHSRQHDPIIGVRMMPQQRLREPVRNQRVLVVRTHVEPRFGAEPDRNIIRREKARHASAPS